MILIKAPKDIETSQGRMSIFLAGSIEGGIAKDWQSLFRGEFTNYNDNIVIIDPRRDDYDTSIKMSKDDKNFIEQINWDQNMLERSDIIAMYLDPKTRSPISLIEFGQYVNSGKLIVCCPEGFWRKGNIEVMCERNNVPVFDNFSDFIQAVKDKSQQV